MLYWATELALQALERRTQQALHELERPRMPRCARFAADDADRAEQLLVGIAQQEDVGTVIAVDGLGEAARPSPARQFLRERLLQRAGAAPANRRRR